mgnify:CR=1 FL=1
MERLWAPWRMEYILNSGQDAGCFLCRAIEAPLDNAREALLVHKTESAIIVMNRFPYNNGHLLAAPVRHTADLTELSDVESSGLIRETAFAEKLLRKALSPDGFNIGINVGATAGAGLPGHVHVHIVPRWQADTNFMPVTADVKVIPEALDALYGRLVEALEAAR